MKDERKRRASRIFHHLARAYPDARCELNHGTAFELLIATILSAQCTDERVNFVTRDLFRKYPRPQDYGAAPAAVLEQEIRSTGFFRAKARSILAACRMLEEEYGGRVPDTMEDLVRLPGVARKTANVVLGVAFGKAEGVVVDTHVFRVSHRLELTRSDTPEKVERDLMAIIPRGHWIAASHQLIFHGRYVCKARKPLCFRCSVADLCNSKEKMRLPAS